MMTQPNFDHVIVTGGASGIGAAVVELLLQRGSAVTVFDLQSSPNADVQSEIVDLSDEAAIDAAVEKAFGRASVSGLVACHGIRGAFVPALEMELDTVRRLYDIHVIGTLAVARSVVRRLEGAPASIVMISSTTAYGGWVNQVDYGLAKAAVSQLVQNLAMEWAPLGVRVNGVAPGHTTTPMVQDMIDKGYDMTATVERTPRGQLATPTEMALSILWLLTDATHVLGQILPVDGGWTVVGK